jgi:HD-GYP domain-containing protein (c-di-GMP phosphodiesterase class II)
MHPEIGKHILSNATLFNDIIPIVLHHHERYDGKGYPSGLKGNKIPDLVRIVTIADAFDAMTSTRSYRPALEIDVVKEEIRKNRGTQFDEKYADVFLDILENDYDKILDIKEKFPSNK